MEDEDDVSFREVELATDYKTDNGFTDSSKVLGIKGRWLVLRTDYRKACWVYTIQRSQIPGRTFGTQIDEKVVSEKFKYLFSLGCFSDEWRKDRELSRGYYQEMSLEEIRLRFRVLTDKQQIAERNRTEKITVIANKFNV